MLRLPSILLISLVICTSVHAAPADNDRQQLEKIVETFRLSLINKDKASFMQLLYSADIAWLGVATDNTIAMVAGRGTTLPKVAGNGNAVKFIDSIVSNPARIEEKFDNVRIDTDGDIAQVYFDYSFNQDDYRSNWGKESWQLVRTGDGWKINSVIWSMEFNPEKRPKQAE